MRRTFPLPDIASKRTTPRRFVPEDFNPTDRQQITTYAGKLQERDLSSVEEVENFILDWEELGAVLYEAFSQAYVDMTADTANKESETRYLQIIQEVLPVVEPLDFELKQKLLRSPAV